MRGCAVVKRVAMMLTVLVVMWPGVAAAQFTGWATVGVGKTTGGDTTNDGNAFSVSATAFESRGWFGAEIDLSHSTRFNDEAFADSGLTSLMLSVVASPHIGRIQPYVAGGAGLMRARGCVASCARTLSHTEFGINTGGGVHVPLTELLAVGADVRYFRVLKQGDDFPRTASGSFNYFRVLLGASFTWSAP